MQAAFRDRLRWAIFCDGRTKFNCVVRAVERTKSGIISRPNPNSGQTYRTLITMDTRKRGAATVFGRVTNDQSEPPSPKRQRREEKGRHRRKGGSNRLMLQKSFAYITSMYSCTEFAKVATTDREDTISIFSRKVNTKRLTESSTTYCVLRSWVQDDPDRASNSDINSDVTVSEAVKSAAADPLIAHLKNVLNQSATEKGTTTDILKSVNSLCNIPTSELLLTHVAYYKKIREIWLMIAAVRYSHLRKKLMDMGAPASTAMDRILQKEKEDISLKKVAAILQLPEPRFDGVITALEEDDSMKLDDT